MRGFRSSVLERIDGAAAAARKARRDPRDAEALHRFRVDARRVVICVKMVERLCGIPPELRKRLRRGLRATGPWRDKHVRELWLRDYARRFRSQEGGAKALARALAREGPLVPIESARWREIERTLRKLRGAVASASIGKAELRAARRDAVEKARRRLARRLRRSDGDRGPPAIHAARVAVKKLRCLLEMMKTLPDGAPAPAVLRGLQAALGEAHDRAVIAAAVSRTGRDAEFRVPARQALRQLRREQKTRMSCAGRYWSILSDQRPGPFSPKRQVTLMRLVNPRSP